MKPLLVNLMRIKNDLYYLCENGTKIVYQGKTLYKKALEKQDAQEVLDILKEDQEMYASRFRRQACLYSKALQIKKILFHCL